MEAFRDFKSLEAAKVLLVPVLVFITPKHMHIPPKDPLRSKLRGRYDENLQILFSEGNQWDPELVLEGDNADFMFKDPFDIYINTSKVEGNLYEVHIPLLGMPYLMGRGASLPFTENQPLVTALLQNRV